MPSFPGHLHRFAVRLATTLILATGAFGQAEEVTDPAPAYAWNTGLTPEHLEIARALRASRGPDAPPTEELVARIIVAGPSAVSTQFDILARGRVPQAEEDDLPQILSEPQRALLLAALSRMPESAVRATIESRLAEDPEDAGTRLAAIHAFGSAGDAKDLRRLVDLAPRKSSEDRSLLPDARRTLRSACAAIVRRDPRAIDVLSELVNRTDASAGRALIEALGDARNPRALEVFQAARALPELRPQVVALAAACGKSMDPALDQAFAVWAMSELPAARPEYARTLLQAMGALDDGACVPAMIERLEDEDSGVRDSALFALRRVSGLGLPGQAASWQAWHQAEVAWHAHERGRCSLELQSKDPQRMIRALRAYSEHRTRRAELSLDVEKVLADRQPEIRRLACEVLGRLGSASACVALLGVLEDSDRTVAEAARRALQEITGRELPKLPREVRQVLRGP